MPTSTVEFLPQTGSEITTDTSIISVSSIAINTGPKGEKGDKGDQGPPGEDGKDGVRGAPGQDGAVQEAPTDGKRYLRTNGTWSEDPPIENDHSLLTNLGLVDQHPIGAVTGLISALANKSDINHTHVEADITNLDKYTQAEVGALLAAQTHVEADILDLDKYTQAQVTAFLAGKSDTTHNHAGTYEPVDATILRDADIGVTVEAFDATIVKDADIGVTVEAYDATILKDADIGVTVEAYDATIVKDADIGVTVQAYDANTAKTDVAQEFTKPQWHDLTGIVFDATQDWDWSLHANAAITLTGNTTFDAPTNSVEGQICTITLIQNATGGHTVAWNSAYIFDDIGVPVMPATALSGIMIISFERVSTVYLEVGRRLFNA